MYPPDIARAHGESYNHHVNAGQLDPNEHPEKEVSPKLPSLGGCMLWRIHLSRVSKNAGHSGVFRTHQQLLQWMPVIAVLLIAPWPPLLCPMACRRTDLQPCQNRRQSTTSLSAAAR